MARAKRVDNKGRVLRVGESQNKDGRYCYKWTDSNGKRSTVYALTLAELRKKEEQIKRDQMDGIYTKGGNLTLNEFFRLFMSTKKNIRDSTRCNYKSYWKNAIAPSALGIMKISEIKQIHVKRLYADLLEKGYSPGTIRAYHIILSECLQAAVDSDMIRKNPAKGSRKGIDKEVSRKRALTIEEQEIMLEFTRKSNSYKIHYPLIVFALSTGLRVGELGGLLWDDIDLEKNMIHVRRQLVYRNLDGTGCKFHIQPLKTEAGERDIPLTKTAKKALMKQREYDLLLGKRAKEQPVAGLKNFVFLNHQGNQLAPQVLDSALRNIIKAYNKKELKQADKEHGEPFLLPHISAHILRHTFCTRAAESGVDVKSLQYILGHADITMTMERYNHVDEVRVQNEMSKTEGIVKIG